MKKLLFAFLFAILGISLTTSGVLLFGGCSSSQPENGGGGIFEIPQIEYINIIFDKNTQDDVINMPNSMFVATDEHDEEQMLVANFTLVSEIPQRKDFNFIGWNTKMDGSGEMYEPGKQIIINDVSSENIVLFAQWVESQAQTLIRVGIIMLVADSGGSTNYTSRYDNYSNNSSAPYGTRDYGSIQAYFHLGTISQPSHYGGNYLLSYTSVRYVALMTGYVSSTSQVFKFTVAAYPGIGFRTKVLSDQLSIYASSTIYSGAVDKESDYITFSFTASQATAVTGGRALQVAVLFAPISYEIQVYYLSGGYSSNGYRYYGEWFSMPAGTQTGYTFTGWNISALDSCTHYYGTSTSSYSTTTSTSITHNITSTGYYKNLRSSPGPVMFSARGSPNSYSIRIYAMTGIQDITKPATTWYSDGTGRYKEVTANYDSSYTIEVTTQPGYSFNRWTKTNSSTASAVSTSTSYTFTVGTSNTFYAWGKANSYTVSFNGNGGSSSLSSKSVTYNSTYGDLPTASRGGYSFDGWWTSSSGGSQVTSSTTVTTAGNHTLYAHWTKNVYKVDINILSPSGEQDYNSGTMDVRYSYSGNSFTGKNDQPEDQVDYQGTITISNIKPTTGYYVLRVTCTSGTLNSSNGTYTYTATMTGTPSGSWDDTIVIQMAWKEFPININILSPSGEEDNHSGTMDLRYSDGVTANDVNNENVVDGTSKKLRHGGTIVISDIKPAEGYNLKSVTCDKGTLTDNGDVITIQMTYLFYDEDEGYYYIEDGEYPQSYALDLLYEKTVRLNGSGAQVPSALIKTDFSTNDVFYIKITLESGEITDYPSACFALDVVGNSGAVDDWGDRNHVDIGYPTPTNKITTGKLVINSSWASRGVQLLLWDAHNSATPKHNNTVIKFEVYKDITPNLTNSAVGTNEKISIGTKEYSIYTYENEKYVWIESPKTQTIKINDFSMSFTQGTKYWFKVEPIRWIVADNSMVATGNNYYTLSQNYKYTDLLTMNVDNENDGMRIISCTESGGWNIEVLNGCVHFAIYDSGVGYNSVSTSKSWSSLSSGWHMFTLTFDGEYARGYLDGQLLNTSSKYSSGKIGYNSSNTIFVGAEAGGSATTPVGQYFKGKIKDLSIENKCM